MDGTVIVAIVGAVAVILAAVVTAIPALLKRRSARKDDPQESSAVPDVVLRTFFQGNFSVVTETVLIVVGTSIGAERYDRVLAQLLKRILHSSNIEADIITDVLYHKTAEKFAPNPLICVGSRGPNTLVRDYEARFDLRDRETTAKVFTDDGRPVAFVYGGGVKETYEATIDFCRNKMVVFVDQWSSRYAGGKKTVELPPNVEGSLREIVVTMSALSGN